MNWAIDKKGYSQRRACGLVGIDPRVYRSRRPDEAVVRKRLRELAAERRRFGYRRLHILRQREGFHINWKKLYRLYKEERLTVRKRGGRKRALGTRAPMLVPQGSNRRWSLDFASDALLDSRRFRILCVIDDFTRECLATVVDSSLSGVRVARELGRLCTLRGRPDTIVSDNGTELTSNAILKWQQQDTQVDWHYIAPRARQAMLASPIEASRCRTGSSIPLSAGCATNASMSTCSSATAMPAGSSTPGGTTTTPRDPIRASKGSPRSSSQPGPRRTITGL